MLEAMVRLCLSFSHITIMLPLVVVGYIWIQQGVFYHAICLVFMSMLYNTALKVTFQIPLSPALGYSGFAFPSGHMQSSMLLYGWLMLHVPQTRYKILIACLLVGIGLSLVHAGYHTPRDVIAAVGFAGLFMGAYAGLLRHIPRLLPWILVACGAGLMLYIYLVHALAEHLWMALYGLVGFTLSAHLLKPSLYREGWQPKLVATIGCAAAMGMIHWLFAMAWASNLPPFLTQLQWGMVGGCLPSAVWLAHRVYTDLG